MQNTGTLPSTIASVAQVEVRRAAESRVRILEEHSAAFRWLMASFLAINGGGLVFLTDVPFQNHGLLLSSAFAFYLGIVAALSLAWLAQRSARASLEPLAKLETFWAMVAATNEFDEQTHASIIAEAKSSVGRFRFARVAGWISLFAFSTGLLLAGIGSIGPTKAAALPVSTSVTK